MKARTSASQEARNTTLRWIALRLMALYGTFLVTIPGAWFFHVAFRMPRTDPNADELVFTMCILAVMAGAYMMVFALFEIIHPKDQAK